MSKEAIAHLDKLSLKDKRRRLLWMAGVVDADPELVSATPEEIADPAKLKAANLEGRYSPSQLHNMATTTQHYRSENVLPSKSEMGDPTFWERMGRGGTDFTEGVKDLFLSGEDQEAFRAEAYENRRLYSKYGDDSLPNIPGTDVKFDPARITGNTLPYLAGGAAVGGATRALGATSLPTAIFGQTASRAPQLSPANVGLLKALGIGAGSGALEGGLSLPQEGETRGGNAVVGGGLGLVTGGAAKIGGSAFDRLGVVDGAKGAVRKAQKAAFNSDFRGTDKLPGIGGFLDFLAGPSNQVDSLRRRLLKSNRGIAEDFYDRKIPSVKGEGTLPGGDRSAVMAELRNQLIRGDKLDWDQALKAAQINILPDAGAIPTAGLVKGTSQNTDRLADLVATEKFVAGGSSPTAEALSEVPGAVTRGLNRTLDEVSDSVRARRSTVSGQPRLKSNAFTGESVAKRVTARSTELEKEANQALERLMDTDPSFSFRSSEFSEAWEAIQAQYQGFGVSAQARKSIERLLPQFEEVMKGKGKKRVKTGKIKVVNTDAFTPRDVIQLRRLLVNEMNDSTRSNQRNALSDVISALDNQIAESVEVDPENLGVQDLATAAYEAARNATAYRNNPVNRTVLDTENPRKVIGEILDNHGPKDITAFMRSFRDDGAQSRTVKESMATEIMARLKSSSGNDLEFNAGQVQKVMDSVGPEVLETVFGPTLFNKLRNAAEAGKTLQTYQGVAGGAGTQFGTDSAFTQGIEPGARIPGLGLPVRAAQAASRLSGKGMGARLQEQSAQRALRGESPLANVSAQPAAVGTAAVGVTNETLEQPERQETLEDVLASWGVTF